MRRSMKWWNSLSEPHKAILWDEYTSGMSNHSEAEDEQIEELFMMEEGRKKYEENIKHTKDLLDNANLSRVRFKGL